MNINVKKLHPDAIIPKYMTVGAAGFDLHAVEDCIIAPGNTTKVSLGLSFEIPEGNVLYICMRSSIGLKTQLRQSNGIGVIDSDYRGEISMLFDNIAQPEINDLDLNAKEVVYAEWPYVHKITGEMEKTFGYPQLKNTYIIKKGDRICQGIIAPVIQATFTESGQLSETARGTGGFGHTGTN